MRKILLAIFAAVTALVTIFAFAGCKNGDDGKNGDENGEKEYVVKTQIDGQDAVIFTAESEVMTISDSTSVMDYLAALKTKGGLTYEVNNGMITSVNGKAAVDSYPTENSYEGYYWAFYLDFKTLDGDEAIYATDDLTCTYDGGTLYYSSLGAALTPCIEGHTYALVYTFSSFSW